MLTFSKSQPPRPDMTIMPSVEQEINTPVSVPRVSLLIDFMNKLPMIVFVATLPLAARIMNMYVGALYGSVEVTIKVNPIARRPNVRANV